MPSLYQTVNDIVSVIQSRIDESNTDAVSISTDLLSALNRAQNHAAHIHASRYPDPLLVAATQTLSAGTQEYDIADDALEDRIQKVEISVSGTYQEVTRVSYQDLSDYESAARSPIPYYYAVVGRKYRLVPTPTGTYNARIWYLREPDPLVLSQGRIAVVNTAGNYVILDSVGTDLATESDSLASYVNVVDGRTGIIRKTLQIQSITGGRITFRSSPSRSSVLGRTISSSITAADLDVDDYLCLVQGTCVPQLLGGTVTNFLIQFVVAEMARKLGTDAPTETQLLEQLEKLVERSWVGRETQLRVAKKSSAWPQPGRRWPAG